MSVTAPLPVPEAGLRVSHAALSLADQLRVPPPVLLRLSVCAAGLPLPCCAVNEMLVGLAPMVGVEEDDVGEISGMTAGASKRRRPRALAPLEPPDVDVDVLPVAAAVSPLPLSEVRLEAGDGPTA